MKLKPKEEYIGTFHQFFGKFEDREYEVPKKYQKEPMWVKHKEFKK